MICPPEPLPPKPLGTIKATGLLPKPLGYYQSRCAPNQGTWQFKLTPPKLLGHHPSLISTNLLATLKNDERGLIISYGHWATTKATRLQPKPLGYNQSRSAPNQGTWQFNLTPPKLLGHHPSRRSTNIPATIIKDERGG